MGQDPFPNQRHYPPLEAHGRQIRLLTLEPNPDFNAPIICFTKQHSLDWNPHYEALSYTWGDPGDISKTPVLINNHETRISNNLEIALRHLRYHYDHRMLWIDALCINQDDLVEKNTQLSMMGSIYQEALNVVIWLGPKSEDSDEAMTMISNLESVLDVHNISQQQWKALDALFSRTWFTRTWVLPEFRRGRKLYFLCGFKSFEWDRAAAALAQLWTDYLDHNLQTKVKLLGGSLGKIVSMEHTRVSLPMHATTNSQQAAADFVQVLRIYSNREASVAHDKIYGPLGLSDAFQFHGANPPTIDYRRRVIDVYKEWSVFLIETSNSLDLLYLSQRIEQDEPWVVVSWISGFLQSYSHSTLPSWVPDWREVHPDNTIIPLNAFRDCFKCVDFPVIRPQINTKGGDATKVRK